MTWCLPTPVAGQRYSFLGTLISLPAKASLDLHSFLDERYVVMVSKTVAVLRDQGESNTTSLRISPVTQLF